MDQLQDRSKARELAKSSIERGEPIVWFEELYKLGESDSRVVPWADRKPNPHLVAWAEKSEVQGNRAKALVVGCGYGDDAEWLANKGFEVTAFDVSETAVSAARRRFQNSSVSYEVADLLRLPSDWQRQFDFVLEAYTLQVLLGELRSKAAASIASTVKDTLLVIARGREENDSPGLMPWPLTKSDLKPILESRPDLTEVAFEDYFDNEKPPARRFVVEYRKLLD